VNQEIKNILEMADMPREGILSIPVIDNESYKVVLFMMTAGQYLSPHTSTMPATVQIVSGKATFMLGGEDNEVASGSFFFMPPNYNHAVKAKEDLVFLLHLRKG